MKEIVFSKYQGTGNDFIIIDNREESFPKNDETLIKRLCNRKFGIGSDGLILIEDSGSFNFKMIFFNPDATQSFCGNGSRCAVAFSKQLGITDDHTDFEAIDGAHYGTIDDNLVRVKMADVSYPEKVNDGYFIHTGSPHYVIFSDNVKDLNINILGAKLRNRKDLFGKEGVNVNFVSEFQKGSVFVRTYERGLEAETLSCGSGVTAVAIVYGLDKGLEKTEVETKGGVLEVEFENTGVNGVKEVYLTGPVSHVFDGVFKV